MTEFIDLLNILFGLLGGTGLSWFLHRNKPTTNAPTVKPVLDGLSTVSGQGSDKVYVRFHYIDGRIEVKKFKASDLDLSVVWKGRTFEAGEWTPDGHIYREVVH